jgi:hypothetical protein
MKLSHLAWNCRGSGGSLRSSTMVHLSHLLASIKAQVCFVAKTRNSSINKSSLKNHFNLNDAFVVPLKANQVVFG